MPLMDSKNPNQVFNLNQTDLGTNGLQVTLLNVNKKPGFSSSSSSGSSSSSSREEAGNIFEKNPQNVLDELGDNPEFNFSEDFAAKAYKKDVYVPTTAYFKPEPFSTEEEISKIYAKLGVR